MNQGPEQGDAGHRTANADIEKHLQITGQQEQSASFLQLGWQAEN